MFAFVVSALLVVGVVAAQGNKRICPLQGPQYPAPTGLASEPLFHDATKTIEDSINANLTQSPYNETTFSIGIFSTDHNGLLYQYHHTDASVANSTSGTRRAGADSIYRIGSISKILTLYMWLISDGDRKFSSPITDFIPQLAQEEVQQSDYPAPTWNDITVEDLAMYLAGIARDYGLNDVSIKNYVTSLLPPAAAENLPGNPANGIPVPANEDPVCGYLTANQTYITCGQDEYVRAISNLAASFPAGYTPLYSNANFALLAIALSNMVGASEDDIFNKTLIAPLHLTGSTLAPPPVTNRSVLPNGNVLTTGWSNALGPLNGAAGAFSTTNDMAAVGKSILNNTFLSTATTRRWFALSTFVDTIDQSVGRGWEIFRKRLNGHTVTLYSKSGYWGAYTSVMFLIPDYGVGFTLLSASIGADGKLTQSLPNTLVNNLLPALEQISKQQAERNFVGRYASSTTNTSISITIDATPALRLTEYVVRGIDLLSSVFALFGDDVDFRLVPNQLCGAGQVGFTGVYQPPTLPPPREDFYWPCQSWLDIDDFTYADVPLGSMGFTVDSGGKATSVRLKAVREDLAKQ